MSILQAIHENIRADYYMTATLLVVACGSVSTTRWFFCRLCHGSTEGYYRWLAVWPVIIYFLSLWVTGRIGGYHQSARYLSPVIALAFGFVFSVANFRFSSVGYSIWSICGIILFWRLTRFWIFETSVYITA
jgi:hypothetical protein